MRDAAPVLLLGLGVLALASRRRRRGVGKKQRATPLTGAPTPSGLRIDGDGIHVDDSDWGRWVPFAQKALRKAQALRLRTPEEVLIYLLRLAAPGHVWPPPEDSPLVHDYLAMLYVLEDEFQSPDPTTNEEPVARKLRLVK